jgi:hypothetical protein
MADVAEYSSKPYLYSYTHHEQSMSTVRRRKNLFIDQHRIDRVKALLHVETETEAIDRALALVEDLAQFEREVDRGLDGLVGKGGFVDRFAPTRRPR